MLVDRLPSIRRRPSFTRASLALTVALSLVAGLAACSSSASPTQSSPATATSVASQSATPFPTSTSTSTSTSTPTTAEKRFIATVQPLTPDLAALSSSTVLALGKQVCAGFASGEAAEQIAVDLSRSTAAPGLSQTDVAFLLGGAVAGLCPRFRSALEG